MNNRQKITIVIAIVLTAWFAYQLSALYMDADELDFDTASGDNSTISSSDATNESVNQPSATIASALIERADYSKAELRDMYRISRLHNQCQSELFEDKRAVTIGRQRFDKELAKIKDTKQWGLAVLHLHSQGLLNAQDTIFKIERKEEAEFKTKFEYHNGYNEPTKKQRAIMEGVKNLSLVLRSEEYGQLPTAIQKLKSISSKKGLSTRVRGERTLLSADTIIGNALTVLGTGDVNRLLSNVKVTEPMLVQTIRSGADAALVSVLLSRMDFRNEAVYTDEGKRETAVQVAVNTNNLEVLRLLLKQDNLRYMQFKFSPVNTLIMQVFQPTSDAKKLNDKQVEMLTLLKNFDYSAELFRNEDTQAMQLMGYPGSVLTPELRAQLKSLDIVPRVFSKLSSAKPEALEPETQRMFNAMTADLRQEQNKLNNKRAECAPLKAAWKEKVPQVNWVTDITPYLAPGLSFEEQVDHLALISPTLVDIFYRESLTSGSNTRRLANLVDDIGDIRDDYHQLAAGLAILELDLHQRQFLVKELCKEFEEEGIYASFSLARFIDYNDTDSSSCLFQQSNYFTSIKSDFFAHPDTFPSELVHEINNTAIAEAIDILTRTKASESLKLNGFPKGRDALMVALDLKNLDGIQNLFDYGKLIERLLERTTLNKHHLQRLHRLKVADAILFERLAASFPEIEQASEQPFNIF